MIRLIIIGDQPGVRKGLQMRLEAESDLLVVGEASDYVTALSQAVDLCPDVALVDCEMLSIDGIALTRTLHAACPQTCIILLSMHDDARTRTLARAAGATAFLSKSLPAEALLGTIRQVSY